MATTSHMFVASLLLLAIAITSFDFSADARLTEWSASVEPIATPLNLSGNSAGQLFEYSKRPSPNVDSPFNLSGNVAPLNLSGNSAGQLFEYSRLPSANVDSPFNLSGNVAPLNLSGNSAGQLFEYSRAPSANVDSPFNLSGNVAPLNLSGNSAGQLFEYSRAPSANVDSPFNLSGNVAPLNLSGNSAGQLFEYSRAPSANVASPLNLSGNSAGQQFEVLMQENVPKANGGYGSPLGVHAFDVINNLAQVILVQCYNDAIPPPRQSLVHELVNPGQYLSWDLDTIDPNNLHVLYGCNWIVPSTKKAISHVAWADLENKNRLPFYCVLCTWKVSDDGLYLLDANWKTWMKAYGTTSFVLCKEEADEAITVVSRQLESQVMDTNIRIETRAEAVKLLQQLDHEIQKLVEMYLSAHWERLMSLLQVVEPDMRGQVGHLRGWPNHTKSVEYANEPNHTDFSSPSQATEDLHKGFIHDFTETASTFRTLFPDEELRLTEATINLFEEYLASVQKLLKPAVGIPSVQELTGALDLLSHDTDKMQALVPEAGVSRRTTEVVEIAMQQHMAVMFAELYSRVTGALSIEELPNIKAGQTAEYPKPLRAALDNVKRVILFDSVEVLGDLRDLLERCSKIVGSWRDSYMDLVQAEFQDLLTKLNRHFHHLCAVSQDTTPSQKSQGVSLGLILLLALLSVYIQQTAVPKITEVLGVSFVGGGAMNFEARPAFVPSEICRAFYASGENLLHEYIDTQSRKCSILIRKSVETPNWLKYKEPRDVRMFADLLLQEVNRVQSEVQQVLDHGTTRGHHHRNDSIGSGGSSRSATASLRDSASIRDSFSIHEGLNHRMSITNRARGWALERDVAKLFKQKIELFTKVSVMSTIIKMSLKTFQEYVRLQTFNRSGYNQIQLDVQYLRGTLRDKMIDEAVLDSLLDEVCTAAAERCIDPIPLEAPILDKLIDAKRAKEFSASSN